MAFEDERPKPKTDPGQLLVAMGILFGIGLLVAAGFAWRAEQPVIAAALAIAAVADVIAFVVLKRMNPITPGEDDPSLASDTRDAMVDALERQYRAGEIDTAMLEKARKTIEDDARG